MPIVIDDYPVNPKPRWGRGKTSNPFVANRLSERRGEYEKLLGQFFEFHDLLHSIPVFALDEASPCWGQDWFSTLDAAALIGILGVSRPAHYIEIGSGNSTKFARFACKELQMATHITSIDAHPRAEIDTLCDKIIRAPLEAVDLTVFDQIAPGDIVFLDGSHRIFTNSDVCVFFLDVLPRLPKGVIVHVHDIFLPDDYPPEWSNRYYSEQYILAAMLIQHQPAILTILPNYFVMQDPKLSSTVLKLFTSKSGEVAIPTYYSNSGFTPPVSFWLETL
jgi:hypothetical protein